MRKAKPDRHGKDGDGDREHRDLAVVASRRQQQRTVPGRDQPEHAYDSATRCAPTTHAPLLFRGTATRARCSRSLHDGQSTKLASNTRETRIAAVLERRRRGVGCVGVRRMIGTRGGGENGQDGAVVRRGHGVRIYVLFFSFIRGV